MYDSCDAISSCDAGKIIVGPYMIISCLKTRKKNSKYENRRFFLRKSLSKRWYRNGIHSLLTDHVSGA